MRAAKEENTAAWKPVIESDITKHQLKKISSKISKDTLLYSWKKKKKLQVWSMEKNLIAHPVLRLKKKIPKCALWSLGKCNFTARPLPCRWKGPGGGEWASNISCVIQPSAVCRLLREAVEVLSMTSSQLTRRTFLQEVKELWEKFL